MVFKINYGQLDFFDAHYELDVVHFKYKIPNFSLSMNLVTFITKSMNSISTLPIMDETHPFAHLTLHSNERGFFLHFIQSVFQILIILIAFSTFQFLISIFTIGIVNILIFGETLTDKFLLG